MDTELVVDNIEEYSSTNNDQNVIFNLRRNRINKLKEIDSFYSGHNKKDENGPDDDGIY